MPQVRIGWRANPGQAQAAQSVSTLIASLYGAWNGDAATNELSTSLYGVWDADTNVTVTTLNTGLYSVYKGENNANDSLSNYNGAVYGGLTYSTGKSGNAFQFNGSNSYVRLADNSMNFAGDFSICAWVYVPTSMVGGNTFPIIYNTQVPTWFNNPYGYSFIVYAGSLQFSIFNGTNTYYTLSSSYTFTNGSSVGNSWYHVSVVRKASTGSKLYINGVLVKSDTNLVNPVYTGTFPLTPTIGNCLMGNNGSVQNAYYAPNGSRIDELYFWNKELTDTEIRALYNSGSGNFYPSLTSVTTASANDAFGTNHGILMNGCTFTTGKIGNAFTFDGVDDYVALPDNSLNFNGDFSASAWFYSPSATYVHSGIVGNYNWGAKTGWGICTYQNRLYALLYNVAGNYSTVYIDNSVVGSWNHVVMVFKKGTGFYLYMNGELKSSFTIANDANAGYSPAYAATQKAYIGLMNYSGDWWYAKNGYKIDGVNVWQRAISRDEVVQLYNSGTGAQYPFSGTFSSAGNVLGMDNGTLIGGCYLSDGKIGKAFTFDGVNDCVSLLDNSLNFTGDFSCSLWFNLSTISGYQTLLSNYRNSNGDYGYFVRMNPSGKIEVWGYAISTPSFSLATLTTFNTNTWYHFSVTKSASSVKIYVNGVLERTSTFTAPMAYFTTMYPSIGALYKWNGSLSADFVSNGSKIDAVSIWQKELTQSEVTELYNSGNGKQITATPIVQAGLVLNLDASRKSSYPGTGTTWTDISGSGNNGTMVNGPVFGTANGGVMNFDGVNDYVDLGTKSSLAPGTTDFTISFWINPNNWGSLSSTSYSPIFVTLVSGGLWIGKNGANFVLRTAYIADDVQYSVLPTVNQWTMVTVNRVGNIAKIYYNGSVVASATVTRNYVSGNSYLANDIPSNGNFSNIKLSTFSYYNRGLSELEITQNFNTTKSRFGL